MRRQLTDVAQDVSPAFGELQVQDLRDTDKHLRYTI
jgi:hypothetical protein